MAGHSYVVRLVDCAKATKSGVGDDAEDVKALLATWYAAVCQQASGWTADVRWQEEAPAVLPPGPGAGSPLVVNMLLFFVLSPRDSVIGLHPGVPRATMLAVEKDPGAMGYTALVQKHGRLAVAISEIYVTRCRAADTADAMALRLARTGFHESMHNQLRQGEAMHKGQAGFAAAQAGGTSPDAGDFKRMAGALAQLTPQWEGGWQAWKERS